MNQSSSQENSLLRRVLFGAFAGAFLDALELWFFKFDLLHFWAAVGAGATFTSILALFVKQIQYRGFKLLLLGALSGCVASIVWWLIAGHHIQSLMVAVSAGASLGIRNSTTCTIALGGFRK